MATPPTILVFDSGLGGLTVFREVVAARPDANFVYAADDEFFPYGMHSEANLSARVLAVLGRLILSERPDLVVIACNTASTLVLPRLRERYKIPFVGTVPAIKPACAVSKTRRVSVLGTEATIAREYTRALIRQFAQGCEVTLVGARHLAMLAEAALNGEAVSDDDIFREITPCFVEQAGARTDTVALACTHYPLLLDRLRKLAPWPVAWVDPAEAVARRVVDLIGSKSSEARPAAARFFLTSGKRPSRALAKSLVRFGFEKASESAV